jgi:delta24(24(1))-sterol reductase
MARKVSDKKGDESPSASSSHVAAKEAAAPIEYEFGGAIGVFFLMLWSHYILFYFWYCYETADGKMVLPLSKDELFYHLNNFLVVLHERAMPCAMTWVLYAAFFIVQLVLAAFAPGYTTYGLKLADGSRLVYHCNGYVTYYICIWGVFFVNYIGVLPLNYFADHYGEFVVASMIISNITSLFWYVYGLIKTPVDPTRSGNPIYDFFMGTILYPRIGEVDIKMIAEVRWSWLTLMILTMSCAYKQYLTLGHVTKEMWIMVLAHWLYSNACVKGEQCIPTTWDMFHEKFGWMLNFWNVTGVPFLYCFQSFYVLKNGAELEKTLSDNFCYAVFALLIISYYIWDTANSQKAMFKLNLTRNTFPQLPWRQIAEPVDCVVTPKGKLLTDGWYRYGRKIQYTGDILMALCWGLSCGFGSSLPYFYCVFFTCMIVHRQYRDEARCSEKYGEYWDIYVKKVPNVFIPSSDIFRDLIFGRKPKDA